MRRGWIAAAVAAALLVPAGDARAGAGYTALYSSESANDVVLESGESATSWFEYKNTGDQTWTRDTVNLGTDQPHDRISQMAGATWMQLSRPARLDQASVAPGAVGRFTFVVTAPPVAGETAFMEYFAPVAEGISWMDDDPSYLRTWLRYRVRPRQPPAVAITAAPARVSFGSPVAVTATASDNVRVNRVSFQLAGQPAVTSTAAPYEAQLPTAGLAPGDYGLVVTAVDGAGQTSSVTRTVSIDGVPNGVNASRDAKLTAGFGRRLRARHTVQYGQADAVVGRLTTGAGVPIAGADLVVATRVVLPRRGFRALAHPAVTAADGSFRYVAPRGPSRQIRIDYTAATGDPGPTASRLVRMSTQAGVHLAARRVSGGVRFSGRLRGGPKPTRGLLVVLQGRQPGFGWQTFRTARIGTGGRFGATYRFRTAASGTFRFRATVREQLGYAYATGRSPIVTVRR